MMSINSCRRVYDVHQPITLLLLLQDYLDLLHYCCYCRITLTYYITVVTAGLPRPITLLLLLQDYLDLLHYCCYCRITLTYYITVVTAGLP